MKKDNSVRFDFIFWNYHKHSRSNRQTRRNNREIKIKKKSYLLNVVSMDQEVIFLCNKPNFAFISQQGKRKKEKKKDKKDINNIKYKCQK